MTFGIPPYMSNRAVTWQVSVALQKKYKQWVHPPKILVFLRCLFLLKRRTDAVANTAEKPHQNEKNPSYSSFHTLNSVTIPLHITDLVINAHMYNILCKFFTVMWHIGLWWVLVSESIYKKFAWERDFQYKAPRCAWGYSANSETLENTTLCLLKWFWDLLRL